MSATHPATLLAQVGYQRLVFPNTLSLPYLPMDVLTPSFTATDLCNMSLSLARSLGLFRLFGMALLRVAA